MTIGRYVIKKAGQSIRLFFEVSNLLCSATALPDLYCLLEGCPENIIEYYWEVVAVEPVIIVAATVGRGKLLITISNW
jgi:hypothetical protein